MKLRIFRWWGPEKEKPQRFHPGDAGFDLVVAEHTKVVPGRFTDLPSNVSTELPEDVWGLIIGRSSTLKRLGLLVVPGVIDQGYRGPLFAQCWNLRDKEIMIEAGMRVAQLIPFPLVAADLALVRTPSLTQTDRGTEGFGSTGS